MEEETSKLPEKAASSDGKGKDGSHRMTQQAPTYLAKAGPKLGELLEQSTGAIPHFPSCPCCGSLKVVLNGSRKLGTGGNTQIFKCADCDKKFSENYIRFVRQESNRQICAFGAKNLSVTENQTVTSDEKDVKGLLLEYHVKMKLQGYKDSTIRLSESVLRTLISRGAVLTNPETIKEVIAKQSNVETAYKNKIWSGSRKRNVINAYTDFIAYLGLNMERANLRNNTETAIHTHRTRNRRPNCRIPQHSCCFSATAQGNRHEARRSNCYTLERRRLGEKNNHVQLPGERKQRKNLQRPKRKTAKYAQQPAT